MNANILNKFKSDL